MKKILLSIVTVCFLLVLVGCGKSNKLIGKWKGATNDGIEVKWEFLKKDVVKYENQYGIESSGKYTVKDDTVTISLDVWSEDIVYKYEVKDGKLNLTATTQFNPSYTGLTKVN